MGLEGDRGQAEGEGRGVICLARGAKAHGGAGVQEDGDVQGVLLLEEAHIGHLESCEGSPVYSTQVIAWGVGAVVDKLQSRAVGLRTVDPCAGKACGLAAQAEVLDGLEEIEIGVHGGALWEGRERLFVVVPGRLEDVLKEIYTLDPI